MKLCFRGAVKLLSLTLSLWGSLAWGEAPRISVQELAELELAVRSSDLLIQIAEEANEESVPLTEKSYWQEKVRSYTERLLRASVPEGVAHLESAARETVGLFRWSTLVSHLSALKHETLRVGKLQGFGVMVAFAAGSSCELLVPAFLAAIGLPELIPISPFIPYASLTGGAAVATKRFFLTRRLVRGLGDWDTYRAWRDLQSTARTKLNLQSTREFLVPWREAPDGYRAMVVRKRKFVTRFFEKMFGIGSERLTYERVREFCIENQFGEEFISLLDQDPEMPEHMKILFALNEVQRNGSPELVEALEARFETQVVRLSSAPPTASRLEWVERLNRVQSLEHLIEFAENDEILSKIRPREFIRVWRSVILPSLAESAPRIRYPEFRLLDRYALDLEVRILNARSDLSPRMETTRELFLNYLKQVREETECPSWLKLWRTIL